MKLSQTSLLAALCITASTTFAGTVVSTKAPVEQPAPSAIDGFAEIGYDSRYIFRGLPVADNVIHASTGVTIPFASALSLDLGAWYGDAVNQANRNQFGIRRVNTAKTLYSNYNELRLSSVLNYKINSMFDFGVGYTYYQLFNPNNTNNNEANAHITGHFGFVDANLFYAHTFNDRTFPGNRGNYYELSLSNTFKVTNWLSLNPSASVNYTSNGYIVTSDSKGNIHRGGFEAVTVRLDAPIRITDHASLVPYVAVNIPIDQLDKARAGVGGPRVIGTDVVGGAALHVKF